MINGHANIDILTWEPKIFKIAKEIVNNSHISLFKILNFSLVVHHTVFGWTYWKDSQIVPDKEELTHQGLIWMMFGAAVQIIYYIVSFGECFYQSTTIPLLRHRVKVSRIISDRLFYWGVVPAACGKIIYVLFSVIFPSFSRSEDYAFTNPFHRGLEVMVLSLMAYVYWHTYQLISDRAPMTFIYNAVMICSYVAFAFSFYRENISWSTTCFLLLVYHVISYIISNVLYTIRWKPFYDDLRQFSLFTSTYRALVLTQALQRLEREQDAEDAAAQLAHQEEHLVVIQEQEEEGEVDNELERAAAEPGDIDDIQDQVREHLESAAVPAVGQLAEAEVLAPGDIDEVEEQVGQRLDPEENDAVPAANQPATAQQGSEKETEGMVPVAVLPEEHLVEIQEQKGKAEAKNSPEGEALTPCEVIEKVRQQFDREDNHEEDSKGGAHSAPGQPVVVEEFTEEYITAEAEHVHQTLDPEDNREGAVALASGQPVNAQEGLEEEQEGELPAEHLSAHSQEHEDLHKKDEDKWTGKISSRGQHLDSKPFTRSAKKNKNNGFN